MWITKKKYKDLEEKIADLEKAVRDQRKILLGHIQEHEESLAELKEIINSVKSDYKGRQHTL